MLSQAIALATVPVLFRLYTPQDFGMWATVQAMAMMAGSLVSLRFDLALVLERNFELASPSVLCGHWRGCCLLLSLCSFDRHFRRAI